MHNLITVNCETHFVVGGSGGQRRIAERWRALRRWALLLCLACLESLVWEDAGIGFLWSHHDAPLVTWVAPFWARLFHHWGMASHCQSAGAPKRAADGVARRNPTNCWARWAGCLGWPSGASAPGPAKNNCSGKNPIGERAGQQIELIHHGS